jgi:hypothetical protein
MIALWGVSCEESNIPVYNSEENAVRFLAFLQDGVEYNRYDDVTKLYRAWFSFENKPFAEYADVSVPVIHIGIPPDKDLTLNVVVMEHENNALPGQYELLGGVIPANGVRGDIILRVYNDPALDTTSRELHITLKATGEYKLGPVDYLHAVVFWTGQVTPPSANSYIRTYNMMIVGETNFISTSLNSYSPRAHRAIVAATGWEPIETTSGTQPWPAYNIIYNGDLYKGYAKKVADYIADYNAAHPDAPLLHNAGKLKGQPVQARSY